MTENNRADIDQSLLNKYESWLQSLAVWDFESLPGLQSYLDEAGIVVDLDDSRFAELLKADISFRVRRCHADDHSSALEPLLKQFSEMPARLIQDLLLFEWELRHKLGQKPDLQEFVQGLRTLPEPLRSDLAEAVAKHQIVPASGRQTTAAAHSPTDRYSGELRAGDIVGRYEIRDKIGQGGMGDVYKARQLQPFSRDVAIKVIRSGKQTRGILNRFDAERQALAMMEHPNIAKVFDAGVTDLGMPYFAMEFVDGVPVTNFCDEHRLSLTDRLKVFIQICRAIQHAHQKGIIHRDIKPSNVLVTMTDTGSSVRVIDFGLARAIQPELQHPEEPKLTSPGQPVGTFQYMSPEQTGGSNQTTDVRSDVYALGIVLYELLTGSTPLSETLFKGQAIDAIITAIRDDDPPRPSARLNSTPGSASTISELRRIDVGRLSSILKGDLDWIVMKALEKEPDRRYESALHFAEDIERFLSGQPVVARPPSLTYRFGKSLRRNKAAALFLATLFTALVLVAFLTFKTARAEKAAAAAESQEKIALQQKETIEREKILQSLLTNPEGPKSGDVQLNAIDKAMSMKIMDDVGRVDLQLAKLDALHRLQRFAELRQLIFEVKPLTRRQEGQIELWKVRKAVRFPEQMQQAKSLLEKKVEFELAESDSRFLASIAASSRAEAITQLQDVLRDFPQHEPSRKLLITLLLLDGRSKELDAQIEESRLLFPDNFDVELTTCIAFALRGEEKLAEEQLQRLRELQLVPDEQIEVCKGLVEILLSLAESLVPTSNQSEFGGGIDTMQLLTKGVSYFSGISQAPIVLDEVFGSALSVGQPADASGGMSALFLGNLSVKVTFASAAQLAGNQRPMIELLTDLEKLSPIPGDALFLRTRSLMRLPPENYAAALEELGPAVTAPCVFPKMRQQILFEAAICHAGLSQQVKGESHIKTAGELAMQWTTISDSMTWFQVVHVVNILNMNGRREEALQLIRKFRTTHSSENSVVVQELQVLKAAKRYPEVLEVTDRLMESEDQGGLSVADIVSIRDEVLGEMSALVQSRKQETAK